jgi:integrase
MASIDTYRTKTGKTSYRVRIRRDGRPYTKVFTTRAEAKRWGEQHEGRGIGGIPSLPTQTPSYTLAEAFERYSHEILPQKKPSTRRPQQYQITRLLTLLGSNTRLVSITPARLRSLCAQLRADGAAPATVVRYLALMSHLFTVAIKEWEWIESNPVRLITKPKEPRGRTRYLSHEEVERLLRACEQSRNRQLHLIVLLALSCGARLGELMSLRFRDVVDASIGSLTFHNTKNSETRTVPLLGPALAAMQAYRAQALRDSADLLFPSSKNPQQPISIRRAWEWALRKSGLREEGVHPADRIVFHSLRHTTASHLMMSGASLLDTATLLGHRSLDMVRRYSHLSQHHLQGVVEKMTNSIL